MTMATVLSPARWQGAHEGIVKTRDVMSSVSLWLVGIVPWLVLWKGTTLQVLLGDGDAFVFEMPMRVLVSHMWRQGHLPLWTPLLSSGAPLAANIQAAAWYPGTLLFGFLPAPVAYNLHVLLHLSLAGCAMYLLMRGYGCLPANAVLAGAVYQCSGYLMAYLSNLGMLSTVAWLPVLLWLTRCMAVSQRVEACVGLAISLYCTLVAGHPQLAFYCLVVWFSFTCLESTALPANRRLGFWQLLVTGGVAGMLLSSVQLVPAAELYCQGTYAGRPPFAEFIKSSFSWTGLLVSLFSYRLSMLVRTSTAVERAFVGFLPVLLVASTLPLVKEVRYRYWWALLGLGIVLAVGPHTPLICFLYDTPGLNIMRCPSRQVLFAVVAIAVLSGYGAQRLTSASRVVPRWSWVTWLCWGGLLIWNTAAFRWVGNRWFRVVWSNWRERTVNQSIMSLFRRFTDVEWLQFVVVIGLWVVGIVALFWWLKRTRGHPANAWLLCLITLFHFGVNRWIFAMPMSQVTSSLSFLPTLPSQRSEGQREQEEVSVDALYRVAPYVLHWPTLRAQRQGRVDWHAVYASVLGPNTNIFVGVASIAQMGRLGQRDYSDLLGMDLAGITPHGTAFEPSYQLLDLLNVRYILVDETRPSARFAASERYRLVTRHQAALGTAVYELVPTPAPFWFVESVRLMSPDEMTTVIRTGVDEAGTPVSLSRVALLDASVQPPTLEPIRNRLPPVVTGVAQYDPMTIRLMLRVPTQSLLVLSEMAYPGWRAWIDGRPVPILTVDGLLRGVPVAAGSSELTMRFEPTSFRLGLLLSLVGATVLVRMAVWRRSPSPAVIRSGDC